MGYPNRPNLTIRVVHSAAVEVAPFPMMKTVCGYRHHLCRPLYGTGALFPFKMSQKQFDY
jgi:hypothetical protein